ncbi:MAG: FKBP-type peptidyl-prolyl cis-trans isomerase [Chrysiogenetes bacterium]|nr:FKBP-type peptidyl-prolyl cis-trans isomerase [Chrysiogenetes bacterium]
MRFFPRLLQAAALFSLAILVACESGPGAPNPVTTPSGLKYIDQQVGTGAEAKTGDNVEVHYTGTLTDGTKFDSSLDRGRPFKFRLGAGKVIKGWDEGIVGMKEGGKRKLIIPPNLAYGDRGAGEKIPPNSTLEFDVELVSVRTARELPPQAKGDDGGITELMIEDIKVGDGAEAKPGDLVSVHYTGTLLDGSKFDSSLDHGKPFEFPLGGGRVIKGWDQGVAGMKVGGKRKLTIPPHLAYGNRARPKIPAGSTLVFEVELLEVKEAPKGDDGGITELMIEDIKVGDGAEAVPGKTVSVHYTGTLLNGTKFDSSLDRGKPIEFPLGQGRVIQGWEKGIAGMKVGGKRKLTIPPALAYGNRAAGPIPPNSTLVFDVELMEVK